MGKQIVYFVGCGNSLREEPFSEGEAVVVDNRRPKILPKETPSRAQAAAHKPARKTTTSRIPTQRPGTQRKAGTGRMPQANPTDRRRPVPARRQFRNGPLLIGVIVLVVAFVLLMVTVMMRRDPPQAAPPGKAPAPTEKSQAPK